MNPMYCVAPWKAICVKPDGSLVPDMQFRQHLGNLQRQGIKEIFDSPVSRALREAHLKGEFHEACSNCQLKENSGGRSRRTFFNDVLLDKVKNLDVTADSAPDIHFLEINSSNKCNLKCRMCNGAISTAWIPDEKQLIERNIGVPRGRLPSYQKVDTPILDRLFENRDYFKNLVFLALRGGEPLLEPMNFEILNRLIDWDLAQNVVLDISTNGTYFSEKHLECFEKFKCVDLYVSIEAVGDLYSYIRGGSAFSIEQLEKNLQELRRFPNVTIMFTTTTMVYNIEALEDIWHWYESVRKDGDEISFSNIVVRPEYLNFHILPKSYRKYWANRLENSAIPKGIYHTGRRILGDLGIGSIVKGLNKEDYFTEEKKLELRRSFKLYNEALDNIRNTSFVKVLPNLAEFYEGIHV